MGIFGAAHGWWRGGGAKRTPIHKICQTYPTMMKLGKVILYLKKIQKMNQSRDTRPEFCCHQHFFIGNQQILLYQDMQIYIAFWYIISNSFNFSWVFKRFFDKPGYNFDDVRWSQAFLKVHSCRFENVPIYSCLHKINNRKISHSKS